MPVKILDLRVEYEIIVFEKATGDIVTIMLHSINII